MGNQKTFFLLAKENKKFVFSAIKKGARARAYENALIWLEDTNTSFITGEVKVEKPGLTFSV